MAIAMKRRILLALPLLWPARAWAHSAKAGNIAIGHAWALPAEGLDGQVFLPLLNRGETEDALVAARSTQCAVIELRRNARYDDPPEKEFALSPLKPFAMRPQAAHLRLIGLRGPLPLGKGFPLVLDFRNAGESEIEVIVEQSPGD
jgi:copper(I)-binding protein